MSLKYITETYICRPEDEVSFNVTTVVEGPLPLGDKGWRLEATKFNLPPIVHRPSFSDEQAREKQESEREREETIYMKTN